jgi:type II secretory pathway component PulF
MAFKNPEIEVAAAALANQLKAGIPVKEAVLRMSRLQPSQADVWVSAATSLSRGGRLSDMLAEYWPAEYVASVKAGEESNSLPDVFSRISVAIQLKAQVMKTFSKLIGPVGSFLMGFGVFMFFMVAVIPKLQASLGGGEQSWVFGASNFLHKLVTGYWPLLVVGIAGGVLGSAYWLKQQENREKVLTLADRVPRLGPALKKLFFGTWAYNVALMDAAGLSIKQQLLFSVKTLPEVYQEGVLLMAEEVDKRGRADSADPDKQAEDDPRRAWPYYISAAFMNAHETGRIDLEFERVAPILVEEGLKEITKFTSIVDMFAKVASAGMIALPMMAYFTQLSGALTKAFTS